MSFPIKYWLHIHHYTEQLKPMAKQTKVKNIERMKSKKVCISPSLYSQTKMCAEFK